jgi:uncharacterized protein (DUF2062 family)
MKPFTINRNSWHYKFNKNFLNNDDYCMERRWEPKHNNFCSYWRATMFRMLFAGLISALVLGLLTIIVLSTYHDPIKSAIVFGSLVGFILIAIGCIAVAVYLDTRKKTNADKPDSLFVQKYKAHKAKICPNVEFKE